MGIPIDAAAIAQASLDRAAGKKFDPSNYDLRPPIIKLFEAFINNLRWQPNFSWEKRPVYVDGKRVEDGDLIVLAYRRGTFDMIGHWQIRGWDKEVRFVQTQEYSSSHYAIGQYSPDRSKAEHFVVRKTADNKLNLQHVETGNMLEWQGHWIGVDTYNADDAAAKNIAFDKGSMYFEKSGKKSFYSTDTSGANFLNIDNRGNQMSIWPVKVGIEKEAKEKAG